MFVVSVSVLLNMNILPDNLCEVTLTLLAWSKFYKLFVFFRLIFALGLIFMFSALSYLGCILWDICWIVYLFGEDNHNYLSGELWSNLLLQFIAWYSEVLALTYHCMMTSSNGNIFRVTGHLCGEFTGPRWIPRTKASDAELLCFLWSASE